jgi:hypothetical protein
MILNRPHRLKHPHLGFSSHSRNQHCNPLIPNIEHEQSRHRPIVPPAPLPSTSELADHTRIPCQCLALTLSRDTTNDSCSLKPRNPVWMVLHSCRDLPDCLSEGPHHEQAGIFSKGRPKFLGVGAQVTCSYRCHQSQGKFHRRSQPDG